MAVQSHVGGEHVRSLDFHSYIILDLCKDIQPNGGCERKGRASCAALSLSRRMMKKCKSNVQQEEQHGLCSD